MAKYEVNGQVYEFPDDMSETDVLNVISTQDQSVKGASTEAPTNPSSEYGGLFSPYEPKYQDVTTETSTDPMGNSLGMTYENTFQSEIKIDPYELKNSRDWMEASRILYKGAYGKDFEGTPDELADYGLQTIQWFNNNLTLGAAIDASRIASKSPEERQAFLYLMDTYDHVGYSLATTGRALRYQAEDPLTWVGLGTIIGSLGTATPEVAAGTVATRSALRQLIKTGLVTGIETGMYSAAQNVATQSVEIAGGRKDSTDLGEVAMSGAVGFGLGAVLGPVIEVGAGALGRDAAKGRPKDVNPPAPPVREADNIVGTNDPNFIGPREYQGPPERQGPPEAQGPQLPKESDPNFVGPQRQVKPGEDNFVGPMNEKQGPQLPTKEEVTTPPTRENVSSRPGYDVQDVIGSIKEITKNIGERLAPDEITTLARQTSDMLQSVGINNTEDLSSTLMSFGFDRDQMTILTSAARDAAEKVGVLVKDLIKQERVATDEGVKASLNDQIKQLSNLQDQVSKLDVSLSSATGGNLGERAGGIFVGENRGLTPESILKEQGINPADATPDQLARAQDEYVARIDKRVENVERTAQVRDIETRIAQAVDSGDIATAAKLSAEKQALITALKEGEAKRQGLFSRAYKAFNDSVLTRVNEYIISTVLAPSSAVLNTLPALVKLAYKPMLNYLMKGPADQAAFREMVATYSTMMTAQGAALNAARLAFKYERSMLDGKVSNFLEHSPAIGGLHGQIIRTVPRVLQATDEYFQQLVYRSHVVGTATFDAVQAGTKQGLKGKELDAFVQKAADKALKNAFDQNIDKVGVIDFLRQDGIRRGYRGDALTEWMKVQLDKDASMFQQAVNEAGKNYADDMLFKRQFSGTNMPSRLAKGYERFINENPIMRLAGQLFFRTPVRVFEEGIRLTPGLNLINPLFLADLRAPAGSARQIRAQGEALLGFGFATGVLALYSNGSITGGGPTDYKQRRGKENGKDFEPYTITFRDGSTFNYRNLDPLATPIKIIVNALDRYSELQYRKSQGEYVDNLEKEVAAYIGVGAGAVAQAIRDANLTEGIGQIMDFIQAIGDPEQNETKFTKLVGQKLQLLVPRVVQQYMTLDNPVLNDPRTLEQYLRARINPGDPLVAKQYDSLGNVRTITNPMSVITGVNITPKSMRDESIDPKTAAVNQELSRIEHAADTNFMAPYKRTELGNLDLRTVNTQDGKETMYDRWQRYYNETGVTDVLYNALVTQKDGSYGTASNDGVRTIMARKIITEFRNAAFYRLLSEESGLDERRIKLILNKAQALSGE